MNDRARIASLTLSIAAVERDTGLSKDTLRVWERRYGFPAPGRDAIGERAYTLDQVEKLRTIKRLMDAGHRPGRIVTLSFVDLQHLSDAAVEPPAPPASPASSVPPEAFDPGAMLALIRSHDVPALHAEMRRCLARLGVQRFVIDFIGPLCGVVGDAWIRGQLQIFEEHLYTEAAQTVLRVAIASLPPASDSGPRVLLTTLPGEPHGLGLLMAQAVMALEGCPCVSLGVQTPLWDIVLAAAALRADIVALGFSGCMNPNQVTDSLAELRLKLPPSTRLWAGGSAPVLHRRPLDGVEPMASLAAVPAALQRWRSAGH